MNNTASNLSTPDTGADSTPAQRWIFLVVISLGLLLLGVDNSILYTALPELRAQLHTTDLQGLWIINAYPLVLAGLLLGTGTLGDRVGHRLMFLTGLCLFGLASLAAAFSPSAWFLVAARAALGFGAAVMMPATLALIRITFSDERERNVAIGVWGSVAVIGAALGPVLGGLLLEYFWWGSVFLINVPIVLIALVATLMIAPANMPNPAKKWDALSSFYALITLMGLVMTIKELANPQRSFSLLGLAAVAFIIGATIFSRRQLRLERSGGEPLLTFDIFGNRLFSGGVIAATGSMFAMVALEYTTTQRFQLVADFSPLQAGLVVAAVTASAFPMSIIGGAILHRAGYLPLISGGFVAIALGVLLAAWSLPTAISAPFILGLLLVGAGAGAIMSVSSSAIIGSAPVRRAGMAAGVEGVSYEFGTLLSVALFGSLLPLLYGVYGGVTSLENPDGAPFDQSYLSILYLVAALSLIIAAITAWCFRDNPKELAHAH